MATKGASMNKGFTISSLLSMKLGNEVLVCGLSLATEVVLLFKLGKNEVLFVANFNALTLPPHILGLPLSAVGEPPHILGLPFSAVGRPPHILGLPADAVGRPPHILGLPADGVGEPPHTLGLPADAVGEQNIRRRRETFCRVQMVRRRRRVNLPTRNVQT